MSIFIENLNLDIKKRNKIILKCRIEKYMYKYYKISYNKKSVIVKDYILAECSPVVQSPHTHILLLYVISSI